MPDLIPGTEVAGRYRVIERLGSGGMADVYLADDLQLGRKVALKLLHRRFAGDPQFVERFRREAEAAAGLAHANIVSVYDRGEWDGTAYISMEYLPGRTLKELILAEAPLDPVRATSIALQVMQAARFAHRNGIVHRDLKPQNVMVDAEDRATVTDFGIARAGASGMTDTGAIMGTAHYVSPEQAQGGDVGPRSDIYAVGVVLYEMLTGRVPFDAESPVAIAMKQVAEEPVPPSAIQPGIPADLEAVDLWALRKRVEDRPTDSDEFINALEAVGERLRAGDPETATIAFAVPAPAPTAETGSPSGDQPPPPEEQADGDDGRDRRRWMIAGGIAAALLLTVGALAAFTDVFKGSGPQVTMPLVVGKKLQVATTSIANAGFTKSPSVQRVQNRQPRDTVIEQHPLAYERVGADSPVTLVVSDGPGTVQVPPVEGLTRAAAEAALKKAGLKFAVRGRADPSIPTGKAIATDPASGISVPVGSEVLLLISTGVEQVAVPDVTGSNVDDARSALSAAGFVVTVTKQPSTTQPDGQVLSQSPSGGASAPKGSTVVLTVATRPSTVAIPDVTGMSKSDAVAAINKAGLNAKVVQGSDPAPDPAGDGTVESQSPAAGGQVAAGSTITVTLYAAAPPPTP